MPLNKGAASYAMGGNSAARRWLGRSPSAEVGWISNVQLPTKQAFNGSSECECKPAIEGLEVSK
ncbi:hypothetical protein [Ruegeria halocynthiae]|uniref:hypothetical protein n=1 Tax=Ruegeria halocynthiae TaxID=985054 RepID=UPI00094598B4|nr:hypothetical protein [Ruegeria halocynthiae]